MTDTIHYGQLMHRAMRGLLAEVLRNVARNGLPGKHHFFITFDTKAAGVEIPIWLAERYSDEMTIVLQEWFADLVVQPDAFSVTLNFSEEQVSLRIPFDAIKTFVDPSVEFGLRFEATDETGAALPVDVDSPMTEIDEEPDSADAEIVSLDSFRK